MGSLVKSQTSEFLSQFLRKALKLVLNISSFRVLTWQVIRLDFYHTDNISAGQINEKSEALPSSSLPSTNNTLITPLLASQLLVITDLPPYLRPGERDSLSLHWTQTQAALHQ